jgi:transcriptional regulator with XRE-family HTH domain
MLTIMETKSFGEALREIMLRNQLTQRELARRSGVDHVGLCRILNANYLHRPERTIHKLVKHVGCTASERLTLYRLARVVPPEYEQAFIEGRLQISPTQSDGESKTTGAATRAKKGQ